MSDYSVHDEEGFARVYDEDDMVSIRRGDLRALVDLSTMSMDFGSGFLDEEQVEVLRKAADVLGIDKMLVTPANFTCKYTGKHSWAWVRRMGQPAPTWCCQRCNTRDDDRPPPK